MSNTNPIDIKAPDALFEHLNERAEANRAAEEQRQAAKAANRSKILRAKRCNWIWSMTHWIIYYAGIAAMIYVAFLLGMPAPVAVAAAILAVAEAAFRAKRIVKAFPKK